MAGFELFYPKISLTKVYVTGGSGGFDQLIEAAEQQLLADNHLVCQVGKSRIKPSCAYFDFRDDYVDFIHQADVVVTHGGAATLFDLLERNKKVVVIPNQFRVDNHQIDIARYIERENYGLVCWDLAQLATKVDACLRHVFTPYVKESFFMADDLLGFLGSRD